jgi:RNA polymerase sigma-70 factor (ECF subfamily)
MTRSFTDAELVDSLPGLRRYACRLVGTQDAEDLVNDAVIRALTRAPTYQPGTLLYRWLCRILGHTAVDWRRAGRMRFFDDADAITLADTDCPGEIKVYVLEIIGQIEALPQGFRDAMAEYALGYEPMEIAGRLGIPVGTAKSRVSRARDRLVAR